MVGGDFFLIIFLSLYWRRRIIISFLLGFFLWILVKGNVDDCWGDFIGVVLVNVIIDIKCYFLYILLIFM